MNSGRPGFSIAPARTPAEIAAAAGIFRAYAGSLDIDLGYQGFEGELAALPGCYAPPAGEILLARDATGQTVGCVALRPLAAEGCCEMKRLYVLPDLQGAGLGRLLAQAVIAAAKQAGYREMRLDTLPSMAGAKALYERLGFEPTMPYYATPIAGTLFFRRRLDMDPGHGDGTAPG